MNSKYLKRLEQEAIYIIRESFCQSHNPVMLYSAGKDSATMLHLAYKAFYPGKIPFPILHVDTQWKFKEMYEYRDSSAKKYDVDLKVWVNPDGKDKSNPFTDGSVRHTKIMKTDALKQALTHYKHDIIYGGARRDEEKSRAKERICSFRDRYHQWNPKLQRPELWSLYNCKINEGESIRVFPISNWTELDVWNYIRNENIELPSLYFAKKRPVVNKNGNLIMVDDERVPLDDNEKIEEKKVRFRTLGCYPLTGAVQSNAEQIDDLIDELSKEMTSERQGRVIDFDKSSNMEDKKREGYF